MTAYTWRCSLATMLTIGCMQARPASSGAPPATAIATVDVARIALAPYMGRLRTVRVRAADREWNLLFDTGGGVTIVSPAAAEAMRCLPRGRLTGHRMSGEPISMPTCAPGTLDIGGWMAPPQTLAIFDIMTLLPSDWPRLDGVVSLRSFADRLVTLDLAANTLVVHAERTAAGEVVPAGATRIPGRVATGSSGGELLVFAGAVVGADTVWLLVDSGNLGVVHLAPHAARLLGMPDTLGADDAELSLALVPASPSIVHAQVRELILDGALNAAWLEQGRLTMHLADGRLWWAPRAAPPREPVRPTASVGRPGAMAIP